MKNLRDEPLCPNSRIVKQITTPVQSSLVAILPGTELSSFPWAEIKHTISGCLVVFILPYHYLLGP